MAVDRPYTKTKMRVCVFYLWTALLTGVLQLGCSKKDVSSELQKAVDTMAQPDATAQPAPVAQPVQQTAQAEPAPKAQAQEMTHALAAYKAGNLDDAVVRLQKLRNTPVMSPEKRIAVNDAIAAIMSEIYALAEKGDARAIQALKTYEKLQTLPR
jgi:hypothetical protein